VATRHSRRTDPDTQEKTMMPATATASMPMVRDSIVVTLRVPAELGCRTAQLAGDLTAWSPVAMTAERTGSFSIALRLPRGRCWRYRFFVNDEQWMNDPAAEHYATTPEGGAVSVLYT
jgi:hypothetical protein